VSDCEELGWIIYRRWWSWFRRIQHISSFAVL